MTTIYNDPAEFSEDSLKGYVKLYSDRLRSVTGGVVQRASTPKVAVILGGGSGHYPAFAGLVGPGFGAGAVVGNLFTSPSAAHAYSVGKAANQGAGVIFTYGNYAGDVMNFGLAGSRLESQGIPTRQVIVTDDIASAPADQVSDRRGIAGDFFVFKIMGAAAERGASLDEVVRVGELANRNTFSLGLAFSGCTFPGAKEPHFTVPEGKMGLGLGIHGEPGLRDIDWVPATELGELLVEELLKERPAGSSGRVAVMLNGLGSTKYEELFLLWDIVSQKLEAHGLEIVLPEVGELVTSLDMGGVSLTLGWLDDELEELWCAPASTPAWSRGSVEWVTSPEATDDEDQADGSDEVIGSPASQQSARAIVDGLDEAQRAISDCEEALGRIDAVAADGDHGRGMVRGLHAAANAARDAAERGWGVSTVLRKAGDAWAEEAGGTSGVLWGAGLDAWAGAFTDTAEASPEQVLQGAKAFSESIQHLGGAALGDKTMVDAIIPFVTELHRATNDGQTLPAAWSLAAAETLRAAEATAPLSPLKGRARPLAERSTGHPDPGALSFALIVESVGRVIFGGDVATAQASIRRAASALPHHG